MIEAVAPVSNDGGETKVAVGVVGTVRRRRIATKKIPTTAPARKSRARILRISVRGRDISLRLESGILPSVVTVSRRGLFLGVPKGTKPPVVPTERVAQIDLTNLEKAKGWFHGLPKAETNETEATISTPDPQPATEKWFAIELSDLAIEAGAAVNFPVDGWCAQFVEPQPVRQTRDAGAEMAYMDPDWTYVQLSLHYWVEMVNEETGQIRRECRTDSAGDYEGAVECGIWIPHWLLKPIGLKEAGEIYDRLTNLRRRF